MIFAYCIFYSVLNQYNFPVTKGEFAVVIAAMTWICFAATGLWHPAVIELTMNSLYQYILAGTGLYNRTMSLSTPARKKLND